MQSIGALEACLTTRRAVELGRAYRTGLITIEPSLWLKRQISPGKRFLASGGPRDFLGTRTGMDRGGDALPAGNAPQAGLPGVRPESLSRRGIGGGGRSRRKAVS